MRSITTPFAIEAEKVLGGPTDLAALFVLLTGVSAMLLGQTVLIQGAGGRLPSSRLNTYSRPSRVNPPKPLK